MIFVTKKVSRDIPMADVTETEEYPSEAAPSDRCDNSKSSSKISKKNLKICFDLLPEEPPVEVQKSCVLSLDLTKEQVPEENVPRTRSK